MYAGEKYKAIEHPEGDSLFQIYSNEPLVYGRARSNYNSDKFEFAYNARKDKCRILDNKPKIGGKLV